jgi:CelD/BcsL family acetyltransferase involved in cellulose biosynthesis
MQTDESLMITSSPTEETSPMATLRCELILDFQRLQELSADWDRLWRLDPKGEIFQSFGWARAWWQSYGSEFKLTSVAVFEEERVVGIVPLVKRSDKILFLGGPQSDYCDILCEEHRASDVLSVALEKLLQIPDWKELVLEHVKAESRILEHWHELPPGLRGQMHLIPTGCCRTICLDHDRDATLDALVGKRHTRRRLNKLRKAGGLAFRHVEEADEAQSQLDLFFEHQTRRHILLGRKQLPGWVQFPHFLRTLVGELGLRDQLRFGILELDGRPLAWHFSFQVNHKLVLYQQAFNVDAWDYAPGEVLLNQLLVYAQQNEIRELDLTRGDEPFKARFATNAREIYTVYVDRPGFLGEGRRLLRSMCSPLRRLTRHIKEIAKAHEPTFRTFRLIRTRWAGLKFRGWSKPGQSGMLPKGTLQLLRPNSFQSAKVEVFARDLRSNEVSHQPIASSSSDRETREGQFSDLVDLALRAPEIVSPSALHRYRQRFRKGDRLYILGQGNDTALVAWTGTRQPEVILDLKPGQKLLPQCSSVLLYECWLVSGADDVGLYQELLQVLFAEAATHNLPLAVCCPARSSALRRALRLQGFRSQCRIFRRKVYPSSQRDVLQFVEAIGESTPIQEPSRNHNK